MSDAERLKAARKALGLTERQMAAAVGMHGHNAKDDFRKMAEGLRPVTGPVLVAAELLVRVRDLDARIDAAKTGGPTC